MFKIFWNYPLSKAVRFFEEYKKQTMREVHANILVVGPFAFCVCWRKKNLGSCK